MSVTVVLLLLTFGCRGGDRATAPEATEAAALEMGPASVALMPGDTTQLEATPVDGNGNPVSGYEISWTSGDTTVATVDGDGTVTALSLGSTEITATAEKTNNGKGSDNGQGKKKGLKKHSEVTVTDGGLITDLEPTAYEKDTLEVGDSVYVDRAYTIDGVPAEYRGWRYLRTANDDKASTSDSAVVFTLTDTARVALAYDERATRLPGWLQDWTATGDTLFRTGAVDGGANHLIFTRVFAPGDVVLAGNMSDGAEGAENMYVLSATRSSSEPDGGGGTGATVDSVAVFPDTATIPLGDSVQYSAAVYDSAGNQLTRSVTWASSDVSVAPIDTAGFARGRDTGSVYITASSDGVTDSAVATVIEASGSVTLTWERPSQDADGSSLEDLSTFRIYFDTVPGVDKMSADYVAIGDTTRFTLEDLSSGTYFFATAAVDSSGNISVLSNEISTEIP